MNLQKRKLQRLKDYDYRQNGAYFITICTHSRINLFGIIDDGKLTLNNAGKMIFNKLSEMHEVYNYIDVEKFIVMPNHVHAIICINNVECGEGDGTARGQFPTSRGQFPTIALPEYIRRFKTLTTILYIDGVKSGDYQPFDKKIWQKSYHDHVIRNLQEYEEIWEYIDTNPLKWREDKYYV